MATTMSDVARAAGVSVMTVSNVINGRPRVGPDTRARVLGVIAELGYQVNLTARGLRAGRTGTIALIVPRFDHAYFGGLAARLTAGLESVGLHLVVEQSGASPEGELAALSLARLQMYDGVLLSVVGLDAAAVDRIQSTVPVVLIGERDLPPRFDHVTMDNVEGARQAVEHMLRSGARRVAIVGGEVGTPSRTMGSRRTLGWRLAHESLGMAPDPDLLIEIPEVEAWAGAAVVEQMLERGLAVDGVFAVTDEVATGVLSGLHRAGLSVPEDVQVVGFDNLAIGEHLVPRLTSVDPDHDAMVDAMVELVRRRIDADGAELEPRHVVLPSRLALRDSTR
ncbi:LacI family transcriptional regulator [Paraoerskovia sediminicola]|uniref:LacI family transcriptional regulator n=1 Tax=Paraoerskovia sediminicola TaxID=1138587 RepID=A0ABM8G039_9CELL|nr:LacI family DNA-binding transcriptional regulator [Paraoerskovia sediminicola]BDZ41405.1 LacI family transcriptional regulator [Paraoerskovia sediminicola]